jgi:sucrose phosphorylase
VVVVKNLYDPSGKKILLSINATFFSLGEDESCFSRRYVFMPGIPSLVFRYFCWKNNYEAADNGGSAGHKEINRTTLTMQDRTRTKNRCCKEAARDNSSKKTSAAFLGKVEINDTS